MDAEEFYRLTGPTTCARAPATFSYSSLAKIESCPRQWQLLNSSYGELPRFPERPSAPAIEGEVVHGLLDELVRHLGAIGFPAFRGPAFRESVAAFGLRERAATRIDEFRAALVGHPRGAGVALRVSAELVVNKVVRLLTEQYVGLGSAQHSATPASASRSAGGDILGALRRKGALTEVSMRHPTLPFRGVADLVRLDRGEIVIADYKSGRGRPEHEQQVLLYALLWWRVTGTLPSRAAVCAIDGSFDVAVDAGGLVRLEAALSGRIVAMTAQLSMPGAQPRVGIACSRCPVRQFCDAYWRPERSGADGAIPISDGLIDLQVEVEGLPSAAGFEGRAGTPAIPVVFRPSVGRALGDLAVGTRMRILAAGRRDGGAVEVLEFSEVFFLGDRPAV